MNITDATDTELTEANDGLRAAIADGADVRDLLDTVTDEITRRAGIDLTTIVGTGVTPFDPNVDDFAERFAEVAGAFWTAARAAGFTGDDVDVESYSYDNHLTVDHVRTPDGARVEDYQAVEAFGHDGRFYLVVAYNDTAIVLRLDVNDACASCGGEFDLAPVAGCTGHVSTESD